MKKLILTIVLIRMMTNTYSFDFMEDMYEQDYRCAVKDFAENNDCLIDLGRGFY